MADVFSKDKRSKIMSAVKHRGSKMESQTAALFRRMKIHYRSHPKGYNGNPDFYLPDLDAVVFVDSCFWHSCRYHGSLPKSNEKFWEKKLARNKLIDAEVNRLYRKAGHNVIRIWEHSLRDNKVDKIMDNALRNLKQK